MRCISQISLVFCITWLTGFAASNVQANGPGTFISKAFTPDWNMKIKSLSVSDRSLDNGFRFKISEGCIIGFETENPGDRGIGLSGPLTRQHIPDLLHLLNCGLGMAGVSREDITAVNLNWDLYPEKISTWADIWQQSPLAEKNWKITPPIDRYRKLVDMISDVIKADMAPVLAEMGFEITGVSMEKVFHIKAGKLSFYPTHLKPGGIRSDLKIPIPMMLWMEVRSRAFDQIPQTGAPVADRCRLDSVFVSAEQVPAHVYFSYNRALDRFELDGDRVESNGSYARIPVIQAPSCRSVAKNMLAAGIFFAKLAQDRFLFLAVGTMDYPNAFEELMKPSGTDPPFKGLETVSRPGMPDSITFYRYSPGTHTGFEQKIAPFLKDIGYRFSHFELSFTQNRKARDYKNYKTVLKPMGIGPDDTPWLPDLVYMAAKKR